MNDMHTHDSTIIPVNDNHDESEFNKDNNNNWRLSKGAESGNDQNTAADTNKSGIHSDPRLKTSRNLSGKLQGSKSAEPAENGTADAVNRSRCSSICDATTSPSIPNSINQKEYPPIFDETTSIVDNRNIIKSTYAPMLAEFLATHTKTERILWA